MLCSEAGDERVSEQGRAVRARARAASPAAPALPLAVAARVPMQMNSGRAACGERPGAQVRKAAGPGPAGRPAGGGGRASHGEDKRDPWDPDAPPGCHS